MGRSSVWVVGALLLSACGTSPPPPAEEPKGEPVAEDAPKKRGGPAIEQEIGALDAGKVKETFQRAFGKLSACYSKGTERIAYLSGEVHFVVRVAKDGSTRWAFFKVSTLGDRETEHCMLEALKTTSWPKPEGGEGLAENSFTFEPGGEERMPVSWTADNLGAAGRNAKNALSACRKKAGTRSLSATMYVETDGKPSSVGMASADEKGEAAVDCVTAALKSLKFPSPGSFASKVTVTID